MYYDIWSNIHYGFVGRAAAYPEFVLQYAAKLAGGRFDEGDVISIRVGARLWDDNGESLKPYEIQHAIVAAKPEYERAKARDIGLITLQRIRNNR